MIKKNKETIQNDKETQLKLKYHDLQMNHINKSMNLYNFEIYDQYRLDQLFQNQDGHNAKGQIQLIATYSSHSLHLQQNLYNLLQKYKRYQLIFIGFCGASVSQTNHLLNSILNLATFQGIHFNDTSNQNQIQLWTIPLVKRNKRIFLVNYLASKQEKVIKKQQSELLGFLLFLCSQIFFVQSYQRENNLSKINQFKDQVINAMSKFIYGQKQTITNYFYQPYKLTFLYRQINQNNCNLQDNIIYLVTKKHLPSSIVSKYAQKLKKNDIKDISLQTYKNKNDNIINKDYILAISQFMKDMLNCRSKYFNKTRSKGFGLSILLKNLVQNINLNQIINIQTVYNKSQRQILRQIHNLNIDYYNKSLEKLFSHEQPKSTKQMLELFQKVYKKTFQKLKKHWSDSFKSDQSFFSNKNDNKTLYQTLQSKLLSYISQKQLILFQINKKKSYKSLKSKLDQIKIHDIKFDNILDVKQVFLKTMIIQKHLDGKKAQAISEKMIEVMQKYTHHHKYKQKISTQAICFQIQSRKHKIKPLKAKNHQIQLKNFQNFQKFHYYQTQNEKLNRRMQNTKLQIQISKSKNQQVCQNSFQKIYQISKNSNDLYENLKSYKLKLQKQSNFKENQIRILKNQLKQANQIEEQQIKNQQKNMKNIEANSLTSFDQALNNSIDEKVRKSPYQQNKPKQVSKKLLKSKIGQSSNAIHLVQSKINEKIQTKKKLQEQIEKTNINLQRSNIEYKNNRKIAAQSRKILSMRSPRRSNN